MKQGPCIAVVLAGGSGRRFTPGPVPKQLVPLDGRPLFTHCLETYLGIDRIDGVRLVVHADHADRFESVLHERGLVDRVSTVLGGPTRQASIANALRDLDFAGGLVVLQNAASPLTSPDLVRRCLDAAGSHVAVQAFVPALHTVFDVDGQTMGRVLPRARLGYTCDPTVYRLDVLRRVVAALDGDPRGEDTVSVARRLGIAVHLVRSDHDNLKITTRADLGAAEALLAGARAGR